MECLFGLGYQGDNGMTDDVNESRRRDYDLCGMFSAFFSAPNDTDWNGRTGPSPDVKGGRLVFRDKLIAGYWPIVWSIAVFANENAPLAGPVRVEFGFTPGDSAIVPPGAGTPPVPSYIVFADNIAPAVAPFLPSAVNTNWGNGWIVPQVQGVPYSFFLESQKAGQTIGISAQIQWSWMRIGDLR